MLQSISTLFFVILCGMIGYSLIVPWLSKDKTLIWSPITILSLIFIYYIVLPVTDDISMYGASTAPNQYLFFVSAVLFFGSILFAFKRTEDGSFSKWNYYFTTGNAQKISISLFIIALLCYIPFRGFRFTISAEDATLVTARTGLVSYFIDLISLFVGTCCLAFVGYKNTKGLGIKKRIVVLIILYFTLVMFIVGGFRYRLVILILALATTYHLYPSPRKINYIVLVPVAIITYLGFAIMDTARSYGRGIDLDVAKTISLKDAQKGAGESTDVCCFSIATIDYYSRNDVSAGIEPILTAVLMPIPRSIFPSKPAGEYMKEAQIRVIGDASGGAAVLIFAEAYMSFGLLGVILYGLFIGWLCKKIWSNYQNNKDSIGAILLLALFNGFMYTWMSRGYMAGAFNDFIYFVVLPFWLTALINRFSKSKS